MKQTIKQRKAIRSAAARKGWETRREKAARVAAIDHIPDAVKSSLSDYRFVLAGLAKPTQKPSAADAFRVAAHQRRLQEALCFPAPARVPPPSLWQRIKGWFA